MAEKKRKCVTKIYVYEGESLKTIYARVREAFDMMKNPPNLDEYCILASTLLAELDELDRQTQLKKKRKRKHAG